MNKETLSPYGIFCLSVGAFAGLLFGYHTAIISGALFFLSRAFHLTAYAEGMVVSIMLPGMLIGALLGGMCADRFGRKRTLLFTALLCSIGAAVIFSAEGYFQLLIGRLLTGFAVGIISVVGSIYVAEIAPPPYAGKCVIIFQLAIPLGIILAYITCFFFAEEKLWRPLFLIGALLAIVQFFALFFVPETPKWSIAHNKKSQAVQALKALDKNLLSRFFYLLFIGAILCIFQQITGINAVIYYTPKIFQEVGIRTVSAIFIATLGVGVINLFAAAVSFWALDKRGRKPLLLLGTAGMFLSLSILSYALFTKTEGSNEIIICISLIIFIASFSLSLGTVLPLVLVEIYPISIRGKAIAIAVACNCVANYLVCLFFPDMLARWGGGCTFALFAIFSLIAFLFIYRYVPETKGKTFKEIETMVKLGKLF